MQAAFNSSSFWSENTFIDNSVHFAILVAGKAFEDALFESSLVEFGGFLAFFLCFLKGEMVKI